MFVLLLRFSVREYTTMLFTNPNAMKIPAHMPFQNPAVYDMANAHANEIAAKTRPKSRALSGGEILPLGIGRPLVRSIIASMSLSW